MINYSKCAERFVKQHYKIIAMLILAVAVIPFLMLTYYSRPCVDDYSYAVDTHALIKAEIGILFHSFVQRGKQM